MSKFLQKNSASAGSGRKSGHEFGAWSKFAPNFQRKINAEFATFQEKSNFLLIFRKKKWRLAPHLPETTLILQRNSESEILFFNHTKQKNK
mgnify:FL=1